jgi:membrane dipeptidase
VIRRSRGTCAVDSDVEKLFESAIVIDGLNTSRWGWEDTYVQLQDGGITAINATIAIWDDFLSTMESIQRWLAWFKRFRQLIRPVRTVAEIHAAKAERRTGIILGWQNATPLEDDLGRVALFHELGVRIVQLTYNERNLLGGGCYEPNDGGLSLFGRDAVRELNEAGILIDLSHCGDRTTVEAIEASQKPVAITHANARSQIRHPRNKTDEAIRLLAERGGVIGANAFPLFFRRGYDATLADYLDAIERLVELAGINHVGVGSDFCHGQPLDWFTWIFSTSHGRRATDSLPHIPIPHRQLIDFENTGHFIHLAAGLLSRGFDETDVRKILGENWLRIFAQVWRES